MKHIKPYLILENKEPVVTRDYRDDGAVWKEEWFLDGKRHRVDGPAKIWYYLDGAVELEEWFLDGKCHRVDGPAKIWYYPDGSVEHEGWYHMGKQHRVDGPAWIGYHKDGSVEHKGWYHMGKQHRVDGPARIRYSPDGSVEHEGWYLASSSSGSYDKSLTKAQWVERTPGLSQEELVRLHFEDPDQDVRRAASRNPKFPEDLEGWAINLDDWT